MPYEAYQNKAAFQSHRDGPLVARFREEAKHIQRKLTFTTCTILD